MKKIFFQLTLFSSEKNCIKRFFELFFNKKISFGKKTIICDLDHFLCVKDLLLMKDMKLKFVFMINYKLCINSNRT